ncbi:MAG: ROK family protein [Cellulosilyticaceae bacterium]
MKILAIDIGGTALKVAETTQDGTILSSQEYDSEAKKGGPFLIQKVCDIISHHKDFDRIGISTAGIVDANTGSIIFASDNIPNYSGMAIKQMLVNQFHVPVVVENDVNAAALGEAAFGAGKPYKNFLCLTYGTGIGGAIVINGQIYSGAKGMAGEFGHAPTHPNGRCCACGQKGCYEQYASTTALVREAKKLNSNYTNGRTIFEALASNAVDSTELIKIVDNWIDEIIIGLVSLVHNFNPECILLGGGILSQHYIINQIQAKLYDKIMPSYRDVVIASTLLGNTAGILGVTYASSL